MSLVFVLCHSLLQLSQLLHSAYFKSCLTTIEKRFGLSSYSSGSISSLHEVGNTVLIVFVSYFGSRVHRPRLIGLGGLFMSISAAILALPHFLSEHSSDHSISQGKDSYHNSSPSIEQMCMIQPNASEIRSCGQQGPGGKTHSSNVWLIMAIAQLLFGVGSVPIQPFGISFVDDFAGPGNAPLYIAILFAVSVFGPAFGYLLGSVMLKIHVDVHKAKTVDLTPSDPRWVGAWWLGLLVSSGCLALTSLPYFFFPRHMQVEAPVKLSLQNCSIMKFLLFPRLFLRMLLSPLFLLLVLSQCCFSSVIAGLSTFLNKYLEHLYSAPASYGSLLIGAVNLPAAAVGMLLGGVVMKRSSLSLKAIPRFSVAVIFLSTLLCVPLFFMGCPTQRIAGINFLYEDQKTPELTATCNRKCFCPNTTFIPVCGSDNVEYISPCYAGCTNFTRDPQNSRKGQIYSSCDCIREGGVPGSAHSGHCANNCTHHILPAMLLISLAGLIASLSHNPVYMMVLRTVPHEEKSFAIGLQFLLMRLLAWLPAPAFFGMAIDSTCIWWKPICGQKLGSCSYYDNNLLRSRYLGLQVGFKAMGIFLLVLVGWKAQRMQEYSLEQRLDESL
ncbi:solute carrier organic anion transporter family member 2A1 [Arapaima gigas]